MKINPTNLPFELVETNVVKAFKASSGDSSDSVIRHKEMFLPAHEDVFFLSDVRNSHWSFTCMFMKRSKSAELCPMAKVNLHICSPIFVLCEKTVFGSDNFPFKIGC